MGINEMITLSIFIAMGIGVICLFIWLKPKVKKRKLGKETRHATIIIDTIYETSIWAYDLSNKYGRQYRYKYDTKFPSLKRGDKLRVLVNGNDEILACTEMGSELESETKEFNLIDIQQYKDRNDYILESDDGTRMKLDSMKEPCMVGDKISVTKEYLREIPDSERFEVGTNFKRW